jgi:hypothetical protein
MSNIRTLARAGSRRLMISLALALATAAAPMLGCYAETTASAVEDAPPAPREELVVARPGFLWIHGRWARSPTHHWVWRGGYYERERPGYAYREGRWERRGQTHVWVDGGWRATGSVVVR